MVQHLCKRFLADAAEYESAQARWRQLWDKLIATEKPEAEWKVPWFAPEFVDGTAMRDGNPIFSAVSPTLRRGIRVLQHEPTTDQLELDYWLDTFGSDEPISELVISCALSDQAEQRAADLIRSWITLGCVGGETGSSDPIAAILQSDQAEQQRRKQEDAEIERQRRRADELRAAFTAVRHFTAAVFDNQGYQKGELTNQEFSDKYADLWIALGDQLRDKKDLLSRQPEDLRDEQSDAPRTIALSVLKAAMQRDKAKIVNLFQRLMTASIELIAPVNEWLRHRLERLIIGYWTVGDGGRPERQGWESDDDWQALLIQLGLTESQERTMSERAPRLKLPSFMPWAIGHVAGAEPGDEYFGEQVLQLQDRASSLLTQAKTVADPSTPLSRRHALIMFRPALDELARYLTLNYGGYSPDFEGQVQPPCNYPMVLQTSILRISETVQAMQDWDAQQPNDRVPEVLPRHLVETLDRAISDLNQIVPKSAEAPAVWPDLLERCRPLVFLVEVSKDGNKFPGTAFLLSHQRFATCAHNVPDQSRVQIYLRDRATDIQKVKSNSAVDVACFSVAEGMELASKLMPIRNDLPKPGEEVAALGFPYVSQRQPALGIYHGRVEALPSDLSGDFCFIQVSIQTARGLSGAPVIDSQGRLVGIISHRCFTEDVDADVPRRSFAQVVPISSVLEFVHDTAQL